MNRDIYEKFLSLGLTSGVSQWKLNPKDRDLWNCIRSVMSINDPLWKTSGSIIVRSETWVGYFDGFTVAEPS